MDWLFVKAFLTMVVIVGLMYGLMLVIRKYFFARPGVNGGGMKVLSSLNLQPKKVIYVVRVFGKTMLVGVSDNSIASLGEITDAESLDQIESASKSRRANGFSEIMKGLSLK